MNFTFYNHFICDFNVSKCNHLFQWKLINCFTEILLLINWKKKNGLQWFTNEAISLQYFYMQNPCTCMNFIEIPHFFYSNFTTLSILYCILIWKTKGKINFVQSVKIFFFCFYFYLIFLCLLNALFSKNNLRIFYLFIFLNLFSKITKK